MALNLNNFGVLAQLARALALQAKGHRFDSDMLHEVTFTGYERDMRSNRLLSFGEVSLNGKTMT